MAVSLCVRSRIKGVLLERMDELFGVTDAPTSVSGDAEDVPRQKSEDEVTETRVERQVELETLLAVALCRLHSSSWLPTHKFVAASSVFYTRPCSDIGEWYGQPLHPSAASNDG
jgi:hypothetical protein